MRCTVCSVCGRRGLDIKFVMEWQVWVVDHVVTATSTQGALSDYHIGPLELQEDGQTGGIRLGSQATAAEE